MNSLLRCNILQYLLKSQRQFDEWEPARLDHGSYNFKQTKFKDFSRTFQGQKLVFKDSVLFTKSTFLVPLLTLKTLNSLITYLRYVNNSAMVDDVSL